LSTRTDAVIRPLETADFEAVAKLAHTIWSAHYITMITQAQIDYMLAGRFTAENLMRYVDSDVRWMEVLEVGGELVGYCSYACTDRASEIKLEQLYLLPTLHGKGLGSHLLHHVERRAQTLGAETLFLQVNKQNEKAIRAYRRNGFDVREEIVLDIGNGYVMDDYIMQKRLR
jgi:ribosomal protein S18 acetylase RimI-like enzyme